MSKHAQTVVTKQEYFDTTLRDGETIPVRIERVIYHRTKTMTVRKWCMNSGMIIAVFRDLPAPPEIAIMVE
jgi:hypothetical protein